MAREPNGSQPTVAREPNGSQPTVARETNGSQPTVARETNVSQPVAAPKQIHFKPILSEEEQYMVELRIWRNSIRKRDNNIIKPVANLANDEEIEKIVRLLLTASNLFDQN